MKIVACYKVVRDDADLVVAHDRTVSFERAGLRIGDYDLNAIEAGAQLAAANDAQLIGLTIGGEEVRDTKLRKSVLSRGVNSGTFVIDPALTSASAEQTAQVLAAALTAEPADLVLCGEGSADRYAQQVGAQLAARLGLPYVNAVSRIEVQAETVLVERTLENEVECLQVSLPALLSVTSDLNSPRIPSMKDILGAGKKPVVDKSLADLGIELPPALVSVEAELAPQARPRSGVVHDAAQATEFFAALRQLIGKDAL